MLKVILVLYYLFKRSNTNIYEYYTNRLLNTGTTLISIYVAIYVVISYSQCYM